MLIWILCSLVTMLVIIRVETRVGDYPHKWDGCSWGTCIVRSLMFPVFYVYCVIGGLSNFLGDIDWRKIPNFAKFLTQPVNLKWLKCLRLKGRNK